MDTLYLAPIRGVTDSVMRSAMARHFGGIDLSVAPFVRLGKESRRPEAFRDLAPERNTQLAVIPQFLGNNPRDFIEACHKTVELGYSQVNWNLGCPFSAVVKKKIGSGMLSEPDRIVSFLDEVLPKVAAKISIKTRLGVDDPRDLVKLIPRLNGYPIGEIIIHPRTASQAYEGEIDLDNFDEAMNRSSHTIVYNGDITSVKRVEELARRFEKVKGWMIGRGLLVNPFLALEIKKGKQVSHRERLEKICKFHEEISKQYRQQLSGPSHYLDKMKGIWNYLGDAIEADRKFFKQMRKIKNIGDYEALVGTVFSASSHD